MIYCIAGYIGGGLYLAILAVSIVTATSKHRNCITAPFQEPGNIVNSRSLYEMCIHMIRNGSIIYVERIMARHLNFFKVA